MFYCRLWFFTALIGVSFLSPMSISLADPSDEKSKNPFRPVTLEDVFDTAAGGVVTYIIPEGSIPNTSQLLGILSSSAQKYAFYLSVAKQACEKIAPGGRILSSPVETSAFQDPDRWPGYKVWSIFTHADLYCKNPKKYVEWRDVCGKNQHQLDILNASPITGTWNADSPRAGDEFAYAYEYSFRTDRDMYEELDGWIDTVNDCTSSGGYIQPLGATSVNYHGFVNGRLTTINETILAVNCCIGDDYDPNRPIS